VHCGDWRFELGIGREVTLQLLHDYMLERTPKGQWRALRDVLSADTPAQKKGRVPSVSSNQKGTSKSGAANRLAKLEMKRQHAVAESLGHTILRPPAAPPASTPAHAFVEKIEAERGKALQEKRAALHAHASTELRDQVRKLQRRVSKDDNQIQVQTAALEQMQNNHQLELEQTRSNHHQQLQQAQDESVRVLQKYQVESTRERLRLEGELRESRMKLKMAGQQEATNRTAAEQASRQQVNLLRNRHEDAHSSKYTDMHNQLKSARQEQGRLLAIAGKNHQHQLASALLAKEKEKDAEKIELMKQLQDEHDDRVAELLTHIKALSAGVTEVEPASVIVMPTIRVKHGGETPGFTETDVQSPGDRTNLEFEVDCIRADRDAMRAAHESQVGVLLRTAMSRQRRLMVRFTVLTK
jgi:hypothetical protein